MVEYFDCNKTSLKQGAKGAEVTLLQTNLKLLGYYVKYQGSNLKVDGDYGKYTTWAVKEFQKATGHDPDGWFGPKTCKSLNELLQKKYGTNTTPTKTTTSQTTTPSSNVAQSTQKITIDTSKNVFTESEANITIEGLRFMMTNFNFDKPTRNGDTKSLELLDGSFEHYKAHPVARAYSFDTEITLTEYKQLYPELVKLEQILCTVNCHYFGTGKFFVSFTPSLDHVRYVKLSFKLSEGN